MGSSTRFDRLVLGLSVVVLTGALLFLFPADKHFNYIDGSPGAEMTLGVCYGLAGILTLMHFRETLAVALRSKTLVALAAMALFSGLWAQNSSLAFRHSVAVCGTTLVGVLFASRLESEERLLLLRRIMRVLNVVSLFVAVLLPRYGVESSDPIHIGNWIGVYGNKNKLGAYVALSFLIDCFTPMRLRQRVFWSSLYLLLLIKSGSASPLVALFATGVLIKVFQRMRTRHRMSVKAILILTISAILTSVAAGFGTGAFPYILGRGADLTGRTALWAAIVPAVAEHPLLGYGYDAFWAGASDEYYIVERQLYWEPMYSHNGYIEVMVSLGVIGLLLSLAFLIRGGFYAFRKADIEEYKPELFPLALLILYLIRNITECTIMYANSLEWAILVATMLGVMPRHAREQQMESIGHHDRALHVSREFA